jgi:E3 ubiquitin-protein ligase RGLG
LAGPTSFAPLIRESIKIVKQTRSYHILIIIADGQVTPDSEWCKAETETRNAIVEASNYPLSIIVVGVGDGEDGWKRMNEFDDELPERKFDNFQFVDFYSTINSGTPQFADVNFSLAALMEIPEQYQMIKKLGLLDG